MSRKSKRRRMRQPQPGSPDPRSEATDGFEFLDDRRAGVPTLVVEPVPEEPDTSAAQRIESVPALPAPRLVVGEEDAETERGAPPRRERPSPARPPVEARPRAVEPVPVKAKAPAPPVSSAPVTTLGEMLVTTREARGLTIEEASARTRISAKMLAHLENDRFGEFAADAYARGFLRSYGAFLGLDPQLLLERYEALHGGRPQPAPEVWEAAVEPVRPAPRHPRPSRRTVVRAAIVGAVVVLAGATVYLARVGRVTLRPAAGLQQIEDELRRAQEAPVPVGAPAVPESVAPAPESAPATTPTESAPGRVAAAGPLVPSPEDTSPAPLGTPVVPAKRAIPDTEQVGDLLHEVAPPPAPPAVVETRPAPKSTVPPAPADTGPLALTATALDSCVLRVEVDADTRSTRRYQFTRRGETRSWKAEKSFRIFVEPASNLELRLNGRLVPVPADGRTVVLDRRTLQPEGRTTTAPKRTSAAPTRRSRSANRAARQSAAPPASAAAAAPQHAAGPP